MRFSEEYLDGLDGAVRSAFDSMEKLEAGAEANPDEKRMVGHYWLRAPHRAPTPELKNEVESTFASIREFARWWWELVGRRWGRSLSRMRWGVPMTR
jgi:glucose-6-phosphate isomerase